MKVAALAESFGMDCEVHGNGAASPAVVGAIRNCRWYERGLLHPFLDYDEPAAYLNSIVDPMDDQDLCICHNVRVSVKTLILRISKPIPLATTDLKNKYPMALRLSSLRPGRQDKPKMPPSGNMYPTVQANRDMKNLLTGSVYSRARHVDGERGGGGENAARPADHRHEYE